uniref:No apical meristem-associated C-terminal domain-containing protein n=1 Tax=Romanomermis culicivorax TaxID=13658 RepID=A0A915HWC8_ROMCU
MEKSKWKNLKSKAKEEFLASRKSALMTGGSPSDQGPPSDRSHAIVDAYGDSAASCGINGCIETEKISKEENIMPRPRSQSKLKHIREDTVEDKLLKIEEEKLAFETEKLAFKEEKFYVKRRLFDAKAEYYELKVKELKDKSSEAEPLIYHTFK